MEKIDWRDWSDAAFDESRDTQKPVLLDISAVWCHWCHVMDETTYSHHKVSEIINNRFIPVRIDTDRNPDINARYNMGGWPTTAFLTHNRDVIFGATYIPPDQMVQILNQVADAYTEQGDALVRKARDVRLDAETQLSDIKPGSAGPDDVKKILDIIRSSYDVSYGGFGFDQKFLHTEALELLLFNYERTGNEQDLRMVVDTLNAMLKGEIFDPVEGGVFRYATRRDWTVPHYEKMLDDNANMASVLLDAYRITANEEYMQAANGIIDYLEKNLKDKSTGAFFGSQDADEEYYKRDEGGRRELTRPKVDTALYTESNSLLVMAYIKLYGVTEDHYARDSALQMVDFINNLPKDNQGTACHYYETAEARQFGNLADSVNLAFANITCYEASGSEHYLINARALTDSVIANFKSDTGGLFDISLSKAEERGLSRYNIPLSENSIAARCLIKLSDLTNEQIYRMHAREIVDALKNSYESYGILAADYALAVMQLNLKPMVVKVHAPADDPKRDQFIHASVTSCGPRCSLMPSDLEEEDELPSAEVCVGSTCRIHVTDPDELAEELEHVVSNERDKQL